MAENSDEKIIIKMLCYVTFSTYAAFRGDFSQPQVYYMKLNGFGFEGNKFIIRNHMLKYCTTNYYI